MSAALPPEQTTQTVRRIQARSQRPSGGPLWLGPAIGCMAGLCAVIGLGMIVIAQPFKGEQTAPAPLFVVTATPTPFIPTATPLPTAKPTVTLLPSPTPEGLFVGGAALVSGTGSALRLRSDPGLQATTLKTIADGTPLRILEGPRETDGLRWWRLQDQSDGAEGWAAETYLTPTAQP
jgi:hypothetical protein